ncbi:TonB-dependent receptor [uncultured Sphingomonas sp.]|uniref:TonB-dependent receptor n=1 Tax=uncultured Sphingomonas sp. TaxID=158754 RepID=UPI0035CA9785
MAALVAPILLWTGSAPAQQTPPDPPVATRTRQDASGDAVSVDGGLEDIVVTAQRRAQNLQDVPIAVTAVSGEALVASGVTDTQQLVAVVPGLSTRSTAGSFQPYIRGIGTSSSIVENPVALYIDGVYYAQQREGLRELNDVEQIAVLKGPQGTLFGRNATGGVIQITTKAPERTFRGEFGSSIDNYALIRSDLYVTGGLTEHLAASLSAQFSTQGDGWGNNLTTGNDTYRLRHSVGVRGKLLFTPTDLTSLLLIGDYAQRDALQNSYQNYPGTRLSFVDLVPLDSVYDSYAGTDSFQKFKGGGVSLQIDHEFDFANLLTISAYRRGKGDYLFDNAADPASSFVVRSPDAPNESFSQEIQLTSPTGGRFNWVLGAFYFSSLNGVDPIRRDIRGALAPAPLSVTVNTTVGEEETESVAPFGQIDWEFIDDTTITLGARWTYERRKVDSTSTLLRVNGSTAIQTRNESSTIREPSFRAALSHEFDDDVLGYLSFNTGIKSGGFNVLNPANAGYLPEKLEAYEVGLKTQLLDRRLRLNLAGFYYDYANVQVIQFANGFQSIVNGAQARLYGLDVDVETELARGLRLSGGFEIARSKFVNYLNAVFTTPRPTGGAIITAGDATGNRLPLAQEFTGTLALDYRHDLDRGARIDWNATANYNGNYFFEPDNFLKQDDFIYLNGSMIYTLPGGKASLMVFVRNLLDERVISQPTAQSFGYPVTYGSPPRTFGVGARVDF